MMEFTLTLQFTNLSGHLQISIHQNGPSRDRAWLLGGERKRADPEGPALKVLVWGKTTWRRDRYDGRHGRHDDPGLRRGLRHGWS